MSFGKLFFFSAVISIGQLHAQAGSKPDSLNADKNIAQTQTWNLPSGDSVVIFESRILEYNMLPTVMIPSHKEIFRQKSLSYSQTSKYVITKSSSGYKLAGYLSDRNRSPNYKFDRVMKKEKYWHFKKFTEVDLTLEQVKELCLFERVCTVNAMDKFDEGDISKSMTVIKHGTKEVCSSYRDAAALDELINKK
jgi:hypothetical protein